MHDTHHINASHFIINPRWIVPVVPAGVVLENYCLVVKAERIVDLLPKAESLEKYPDWPCRELNNQILIPGLINVHGHAAMSLLRGYADDLELMDWLNNHIWPIEGQWVDYNYVFDGTSLAIAEMISTGTTCAADTYFFPDASASAFSEHKFRAQVGLPVIQFPNAWAGSEQAHLQKGIEVHHANLDKPLITTAFAPHAPYTVTDKGFEDIVRHAEDLAMPIHLHLHETKDEVQNAIAETGKRPIARMKDLGVLSSNLQAVHMTEITNDEIALMAKYGAHIAHCPDSNLKLASGFCPVTALFDAGINVAVGTDGVASNNKLDMLTEIRSAALLAKGASGKATSVTAMQALEMGTINGAKLLGLDDQIGSIEIGKLADFITVDLSAPNFQPVHNPLSQLIYSATGHQVSNVWLNGEQLMRDRELLHMDVPRLMANIAQWQSKIRH